MNAYQKESIRVLLQNVDDLQSAISPMSFVPNSYKDEEREFLLNSVRAHKTFENPEDSAMVPPNQDVFIRESLSRTIREFNDFIAKEILPRKRMAQIEYMRNHLEEISKRPVVDIIKNQLEVAQDLENHVYGELLAILDEKEK
ncbi:MAG: hypothetical protein ACM3UR_15020 [Bacteroidota bacterium]|jgi:hypothetical protein|nr:hypothetical protein [Ignavibacteria bacterium]MCU7498673.1 hypothetical protein [Ignavibacteria bacterium]MCU7512578.1 hypothetical protein [Ignavibacteria bacterium]MCU7519223.1 hypothetical protein [Ignavibacteria bacterium]MCU7524356.1 hypothetical protein [Ignavibacteria bacterium]